MGEAKRRQSLDPMFGVAPRHPRETIEVGTSRPKNDEFEAIQKFVRSIKNQIKYEPPEDMKAAEAEFERAAKDSPDLYYLWTC